MSKRIVGLGEISLETEITNKEGSVTPVSINPRAFHNEKGEIFIWTIAKDITERKNQKVQLENQNELLENQNELLEQTADIAKLGGWEIDLETSKTKWTKEVYKIHDVDFDYSHNADNVLTFYHPDDLKMVLDAIEHTKNSGESFELKTRFITAKGENK
jgi:PAS domain-containing protein